MNAKKGNARRQVLNSPFYWALVVPIALIACAGTIVLTFLQNSDIHEVQLRAVTAETLMGVPVQEPADISLAWPPHFDSEITSQGRSANHDNANHNTANPSDIPIPQVFFEYGAILDEVMMENRSVVCNLDPSLVTSVRRGLSNLSARWDASGSKLLASTLWLTHKGFSRREITVFLTLCNTPSMSQPPILNILDYLGALVRTDDLKANTLLEGLVFHELLHPFLMEGWPNLMVTSPTVLKHSQESQLVLNHLHLLAVQKHVYLQLGRSHDLEAIIADDSIYPAYQKAWKIVNTPGTSKILVKELENSPPPPVGGVFP